MEVGICDLDEWEYDQAYPEYDIESCSCRGQSIVCQADTRTANTDVVQIDDGCRERERERERKPSSQELHVHLAVKILTLTNNPR